MQYTKWSQTTLEFPLNLSLTLASETQIKFMEGILLQLLSKLLPLKKNEIKKMAIT